MELKLKWITDLINDDYKKWNKGDVVIIKAQTGTGKTHFIKNVLIPSMNKNEKMLIIANRVKLKEQINADLAKLNINKNIKVMSYQELENISINNDSVNLDFYDYIVCDEAHYIYTDSSFNNKTKEIFDLLINKKHNNAIKIFMSATIENVSKMVQGNKQYNNIHKYQDVNDYSYVECKYFKDLGKIVKLIKDDNDDKWLIFVKSKKDIDYIKTLLKDDSEYRQYKIATATKNRASKDLENIVNDSRFKSKVLISTKVLDNGINIKDDKLKNIVIMSYDKETFIQMLGRKRIDIKNAQQINLYIPLFDARVFSSLYIKTEKKLQILDELVADEEVFINKYARQLDTISKNTDNAIFIQDKKLKLNDIAYVKTMLDLEFYKDIKNKLNTDKLNKDKFAYVKEQLSWLGLEHTFNENNLVKNIDKKEVEQLQLFLETNLNEKLIDDKKQELYDLILNSRTLYDNRNKCTSLKTFKINEILQECNLNYEILNKESSKMLNGKRKKYRYLKIVKKELDF